MNSPERRRFSRILFDSACKLSQGHRNWDTRVIDISLRGVLLATPARWDGDPEASFAAAIHLADNDTVIHMELAFKHGDETQLGFLCQQIGLDSMTHLRRLVELNLGDDMLLQRELNAMAAAQ